MKKVKRLSCSTRLGLRNGMKIYVSEMCAVRLVSASTVTYIYIYIFIYIYIYILYIYIFIYIYIQAVRRARAVNALRANVGPAG